MTGSRLPLRAVIDTNVYISAIFWGGKPRTILDMGRDGLLSAFTSPDNEREISDKLSERFHLPHVDVNRIMLDLATFTTPVEPVRKVVLIREDPEDDKFLECAVACRANYVISGDHHLINLKSFENIPVVTPSDFLKAFRTNSTAGH
jgi:putative PIN family toxin of toxin-antitoxin system